MNSKYPELRALITSELRMDLPSGIGAMAEAVRTRFGRSTGAIIFYGSCLRDRTDTGVIDYYVIVDDYRSAYGRFAPAAANSALPPNVYYAEVCHDGRVLRAKYAVLSWHDLQRETSPDASTAALWARLAQPCALAWRRDDAAEQAVCDALAAAVTTILRNTAPLVTSVTADELWRRAFGETFRTELRAEDSGRAALLYESNSTRYDRITAILAVPLNGWRQEHPHAASRRWQRLRRTGRILQVARLAKATFTFAGGLDYILWKIRRHSGVAIEPTAWQRRHPLLAAPVLALRLYRSGGFR